MAMTHVKKGDTVYVSAGKDRGKTGKVLEVFPKEQTVLVAGVNKQKRHSRRRAQNQKSQIIEREGPIHISNVRPLDPKTNKPTRVRMETQGKKKVRVAVKSGAALD